MADQTPPPGDDAPQDGPPPGPPIPGVNIEDEVRRSFLDYSMSVIISRALPDVRDGLKPVHRRILYAMHEEGLLPSRAYSKCAGVVGEVLKHYHPHGDSAVYDAMVRMAQDFSLRYPLVDGQGNFGSIDGDSPAAYRYTEARLARLAEEMLRDIDRETVDVAQHLLGQRGEPGLGVAVGGGRVAVDGAEVPLAVDQRVAEREVLGHPHHRVVDGRVAVRVVVLEHLAHHAGGLRVGAVAEQPLLVHRVEDAAVDRLEAV